MTESPVRALVLMLGAVACFPLMQACVKILGSDHGMSFVQTVWGRYFFHLLLVPFFFPFRIKVLWKTSRPVLQTARGLLLFLATTSTFIALPLMPLPQITAISFVAPILVTALAALLLKESVGWRRWTAVAIGFAGVLVVVRPGVGEGIGWVAIFPLMMATFYGIYQVLTRLVRGDADPAASLFFTALVGAVVASVAVPFFWIWPTAEGWALLVGAAVLGGIGHYLMIRAYEAAEASFVAPFAYTELVWSALVGLAIFGHVPDLMTLIGAAVIVASGLYVAHRERLAAVRR